MRGCFLAPFAGRVPPGHEVSEAASVPWRVVRMDTSAIGCIMVTDVSADPASLQFH